MEVTNRNEYDKELCNEAAFSFMLNNRNKTSKSIRKDLERLEEFCNKFPLNKKITSSLYMMDKIGDIDGFNFRRNDFMDSISDELSLYNRFILWYDDINTHLFHRRNLI